MLRIRTSALVLVFLSAWPASASERGADVVFVADGAGNYQMASKMLRATVASVAAPLQVETFVWSHGYKKTVLDQTDLTHARSQGQRLAEVVLAYRRQHPEARIHLLGHSAGSMVVLSAAEHLPPASVNCIVLLGPSVSCEYDVRPALRCARGNVEVHYSGRDWVYLGLCTSLVGCADRKYCGASGRKGFSLLLEAPDDAPLLGRLRQHPWQPSDRELGHDGGHYGAYQPEYLKARVLPVLLGSLTAFPIPPAPTAPDPPLSASARRPPAGR